MFDQSDRPGALQYSQIPRWNSIGFLLLIGMAQCERTGNASDRASFIVQAALRSEVRLDSDQRTNLINAALKEDRNSAEAHWARGDVRVRGQWLSLEESAADARSRSSLQKYQLRRHSIGNSAREHIQMAEYCRSNHLPAQERAHWTAVTASEPNHAEARRRLGQVNVAGTWVERSQFEKQRKTELATTAYLEKHSKRLVALASALQEKSMPRETVEKELGKFRNPMIIPGLESLFSRSGEAGGLCTVEAVASMPAPEASQSLVRHALAFPEGSVRDRATTCLKGRDELSFVPELLGALQTPITKDDGFAINSNNQMVWRQRLLFETQNSKQVATFDRVFQFTSLMPAQSVFNRDVAERLVSVSNGELDEFNTQIEKNNLRVMELLANTTDSQAPGEFATRKTPDDWWSWWNDRIESYPSDTKSVIARYETSYTMVTPPAARHECLAAGTPIWTETGAIAVEQVKVGDLVLTKSQRTGELKFAPVLATTTRPPERLLRLKVRNEILRATGGHPFWVSGKGWTKARSLRPGSGLHTADGVAVVDSIEEERQPTETYNLIVDECHSYFAGTTLILSHDNSACEPVTNRVPGLRDEGVHLATNK